MAGCPTDGLIARRSAAVREATQRYGPDDLETTKARIGLALALGQDGRYPAAALEASEVVRVRAAVLGPTDPATTQAQRVLVGFLMRTGEWDRVAARDAEAEAEAELREVLATCVGSLGDEHVVTQACRNALAG